MRRALAFVLVLAATPAALACGACVEDKVAATYDHALATRAQGEGRSMVYAEVTGGAPAAARTRAAREAALKVRGIDARSVRVSVEPATLSFALDERAQGVDAALGAVGKRAGARLQLLKVVR